MRGFRGTRHGRGGQSRLTSGLPPTARPPRPYQNPASRPPATKGPIPSTRGPPGITRPTPRSAGNRPMSLPPHGEPGAHRRILQYGTGQHIRHAFTGPVNKSGPRRKTNRAEQHIRQVGPSYARRTGQQIRYDSRGPGNNPAPRAGPAVPVDTSGTLSRGRSTHQASATHSFNEARLPLPPLLITRPVPNRATLRAAWASLDEGQRNRPTYPTPRGTLGIHSRDPPTHVGCPQ